MEISIDNKAREYIKSKGKDSLTAWLKVIASWQVTYVKSSVKMGKPMNLKNYNKYTLDGIDVYVRKDVKTKENSLEIKYSDEHWLRKLVVKGMTLDNTP